MQWFQWLALFALAICIAACMWHFFRLIRLGKPGDYSSPAGQVPPAVRYAFTGAMSPARKESALLHLPTYLAGIVFHSGTFLSLLLLPWMIAGRPPQGTLSQMVSLLLAASSMSGFVIFARRIARKKIRELSNPDDYISNLLVTLFQLFSAIVLVFPGWQPVYFIEFSILMLYLPLGKLKHTVYFFAARYLLGLFYGRRGVWPPNRIKA
jgi:hypothetical protein